jgi:hypothetical protein
MCGENILDSYSQEASAMAIDIQNGEPIFKAEKVHFVFNYQMVKMIVQRKDLGKKRDSQILQSILNTRCL